MKKTKSLMNYTKLIALCDFIRQNKEQLTGIGISVATAFANDKGHFDWTITESNMKSAAEAVGVTLTMSSITTQQVMSLDVLTVQKPSGETVEEVADFYKRKAAEAYGCPIEEVTPTMRQQAKLALWRLYYTPDMPRGKK